MWRLLLGTMGVKNLVQGLNAAATAGFEPRTVWFEVRRRNRLATAPPPLIFCQTFFASPLARTGWPKSFSDRHTEPKISALDPPGSGLMHLCICHARYSSRLRKCVHDCCPETVHARHEWVVQFSLPKAKRTERHSIFFGYFCYHWQLQKT